MIDYGDPTELLTHITRDLTAQSKILILIVDTFSQKCYPYTPCSQHCNNDLDKLPPLMVSQFILYISTKNTMSSAMMTKLTLGMKLLAGPSAASDYPFNRQISEPY